MITKNPILEVKDLSVSFNTKSGEVEAVKNVSFKLLKSQTLAIIGESGSGKSVSASVIMGILSSPPGYIKSGEVFLDNQNVLNLKPKDRRKLMGNKIAIIFQDTLSHLNPVFSVGWQIAECFKSHRNINSKDAWKKAIELMRKVKIPNPEIRSNDFPHQFSGGQRQRIMIAMALANDPEILVADEPTTALDVTIQAEILELLRELRREHNMGLILITHDLGVAAKSADNVIVMKDGEIVEKGTLKNVFSNPKSSYTKRLMSSLPGKKKKFLDQLKKNKNKKPILSVEKLTKTYDDLVACNNISFDLYSGETLGIVGESGSGKTTISNLILKLTQPSSGEIKFHGEDVISLNKNKLLSFRRKVQVVFQDPFASLNPKMNILDIVCEPLIIHKKFIDKSVNIVKKAKNLLENVGIDNNLCNRFPHEFSGGQRQRIAIARALALEPEIIICDEAVSALDVSIQSQVIELLIQLRNQHSLSYIFIAHDLPVVKDLADRVLVMKDGNIIEQGNVGEVFNNPRKTYTKELLNSSPTLDHYIL